MICEHCGSTRKRTACYWPDNSKDADGRYNGGDRLCPCDDDAWNESMPAKVGKTKSWIFNPITLLTALFLVAAFFALSGCAAIEITRCAIVQNNPNLKCN